MTAFLPQDRPSYRSLVKPALITAGLSLFAFGLAHVAFITWVPPAPEYAEGRPALPLRMLVMFVAPVAVGIPFALAAGLLGAASWRANGAALGGWRYGAALASAFLPPVALSLAHGPYGDDAPGGLAVPALVAAVIVLPTGLAALATGPRAGLLLGASTLPLALPWSLFLLGSGTTGWVIPFVVSLFLILFGSGILMARLARPRIAALSRPSSPP